MSDKTYWVALALTVGIGPRTFANLMDTFGSPRDVFSASHEDLRAVPRVTDEIAIQIRSTDFDRIDNEVYSLGEDGIAVLTLDDDAYPALLKQIGDAPPVLFIRGAFEDADVRAVAIVGTREPTERGIRLGRTLARGLSERGFTIVSGLARGMDTTAHRGALDGNGRTIAVLGSGIRNIHPRENISLADEVANGHGAVISEFHPTAPPTGPNLMARDRVTSGLARGVIVVEAARASGSLDTAKRARKQKRRVFAVRDGGAGTDELIDTGAFSFDADAIDFDVIVRELLREEIDSTQLSLL
ncbi:MAG: DNA-protecting protein DprA [Chloroflexi bacterium]|nr:DNA-protecting protein DprA [Chloroflexota bacterium]